MKRETKSFPVEIKSVSDTGEVEALVAVFNNVDYGGDRVLPGAFAESLSRLGGDPLPFVWSHQISNPDAYVGKATAVETDEGLLLKATMYDTPTAQHVRTLLKDRAVKEFSFTYTVDEYAIVAEDGKEIRDLVKVDVWEAGPTLKGMNPDTQLVRAASAATPIEDPPGASDDATGDKQGTIDPERQAAVIGLLAKTRHTEE